MSYKLIITVVPQYEGNLITNTARDASCPGGTVLMGRESSKNGLIELFGFGDAPKDITYNIVETEFAQKVISAIENSTKDKKRNFGILFSIEVEEFLKAGNCEQKFEQKGNESSIQKNESKGETTMQEPSYEMINVIVNKGYAEDAMQAARKAGAGGGTIIQARGTAKEGDEKFFGTEIVQ